MSFSSELIQNALQIKANEFSQLSAENEDLHQEYDRIRQAQAEKIAELYANLNEAVSQVVLKPRFVASPETLADPKRLFIFAKNIEEDAPDQANEFLLLAANQGHLEAMCALGMWQKAAELGHTRAMITLADQLDNELSFFWIIKAVQKGDQIAVDRYNAMQGEEIYLAARQLSSIGKHLEAFELYHAGSEKGHGLAKLSLSYCYDHGIGTAQNKAKAKTLCEELLSFSLTGNYEIRNGEGIVLNGNYKIRDDIFLNISLTINGDLIFGRNLTTAKGVSLTVNNLWSAIREVPMTPKLRAISSDCSYSGIFGMTPTYEKNSRIYVYHAKPIISPNMLSYPPEHYARSSFVICDGQQCTPQERFWKNNIGIYNNGPLHIRGNLTFSHMYNYQW